jgi:hypothetical protein
MARKGKLPAGMRLRGRVYYAWFERNGKSIQRRLSSDFRTAEKMLNQLRARADLETVGMTDNNVKLEVMRSAYLRFIGQTLKPNTVNRTVAFLGNVMPKLAAATVGDLNHDAIFVYRDQRLQDGRRPRTVNMEVGALHTVLRWAR